MIFKAQKEYWFTPDIEDNLSQPDSKQLKALIRRPDRETRDDLTITEVVRDYSKQDLADAREIRSRRKSAQEEELRKTSMTFRRRMDTGTILRDHVPMLKNCDVEEIDENGKSRVVHIETGAALAASTAYGIGRLIDLLCAEVLREELPEELKKNSESASSSS